MTLPSSDRSARRRTFSVRFSEALSRLLVRLKVDDVPHIKRIVVTVAGGTILVLGVALVVTPIPGVLLAPAGLAILGTEYAWARRWLRNARKALTQTQRIFSPRGVHPSEGRPMVERAGKEAVGSGELPS